MSDDHRMITVPITNGFNPRIPPLGTATIEEDALTDVDQVLVIGGRILERNGDSIVKFRLIEFGLIHVLEHSALGEAGRDVLAERQRQIEKEGWTPEHDDEHSNGELADAAACYAGTLSSRWVTPPTGWPWGEKWWKPSTDRRRMLIKAGALILAEIERLNRKEDREHEGDE